jgi:glucose-6-phosphate isomerase
VDVNAYHQPGVEAGKVAAASVLKLQADLLERLRNGLKGTADDIAAELGADPADVFHILRRLGAQRRVRVEGSGLGRRFSM